MDGGAWLWISEIWKECVKLERGPDQVKRHELVEEDESAIPSRLGFSGGNTAVRGVPVLD